MRVVTATAARRSFVAGSQASGARRIHSFVIGYLHRGECPVFGTLPAARTKPRRTVQSRSDGAWSADAGAESPCARPVAVSSKRRQRVKQLQDRKCQLVREVRMTCGRFHPDCAAEPAQSIVAAVLRQRQRKRFWWTREQLVGAQSSWFECRPPPPIARWAGIGRRTCPPEKTPVWRPTRIERAVPEARNDERHAPRRRPCLTDAATVGNPESLAFRLPAADLAER